MYSKPLYLLLFDHVTKADVGSFNGLLGTNDYFYRCFKNNLWIGHRTCPAVLCLVKKNGILLVSTQEEKANIALCFNTPFWPKNSRLLTELLQLNWELHGL